MSSKTTIPYVSVHPYSIILTNHIVYDRPKIFDKSNSLNNLKKNTHRQRMSQSSSSKCKKAINYLLTVSTSKFNYSRINFTDARFKIAFVTLTLPSRQVHTDNQIKRDCLNPFLIEATRLWDVQDYVWRAERQKNGNIHFHILVDKFLPWQEVRGLWNRLISKLGYIKEYAKNMEDFHKYGFTPRMDIAAEWSIKNQIKAYQKGKANGWSSPNTTDIHSVKFINNIAAYVTKYMTKESNKRKEKISAKSFGYKKHLEKTSHSLSANVLRYLNKEAQTGRLWACSVQLSNLKGGFGVIDSSLSNEIAILKTDYRTKYFENNYLSVLCCNISVAVELHCVNIVQLLSEFICERFVLN